MIKSFVLLIFTIACLSVSAQKKDKIVLRIGNLAITADEFIANYQKNNTNILDKKDIKSPEEYLDLFINFKLKVLEAQNLGYDTIQSFVNELKGYRDELAKPYLTDISYDEEMVKTAYYRTKYERKASHLLIMVSPEASPTDTLAAWNKISEIRKKINEGADFNELAAQYSEDPSAKINKGLLGYFNAFRMVYPFENMAYKTPVGQVSEIVRTRFGYHLIKVHDERLNQGEIKVAHIMKMFPQRASDETVASLKQKADSIRLLAISGADFAELAKKYSDDKQSATQGGIMNWFSSGNMVPEFAEAAFALQNDGAISPVIRSPYGWHIIKRIELRPIPPFEKLRAELETKIKQNSAISKYSDDAFDRKLRTEYQLKIETDAWQKLAASVSGTSSTLQDVLVKQKDALLFSFADQKKKFSDFSEFLQKRNVSMETIRQESQLKNWLDKLINQELLNYENSQLEKKHPEFAHILADYHDGILLFNISKDKIWDAATNDSTRLRNYYQQSTKKYYWNDRFKGLLIETKDVATRTKIESMLNQKDYSKQELMAIFDPNNENNIRVKEVKVEKGADPIVDYYIWNGSKPVGFNETTTFVHGKVFQHEQKELEEAWGIYSSDLQEIIEKEWIDSLKRKYPIEINKKVLKNIPSVE